jgi:hypothetical protein
MFRSSFEPISEELVSELRVAARLAAPMTRLAGLCTLCALLGWAYGGLWAWEFIRQPLLLSNASRFLGHVMEMQNASNGSQDFEFDVPLPGIEDAEDPVADQATALVESGPVAATPEPPVLSSRERERAFAEEFNRYITVQGATMVTWSVVMILAGVFLLCAALSGLSGSHRARRWHRQVVYWTFIAAACTVGGMWTLVQWGGFPPIPDPWILAKIAGVQSSYAIAIIVALIATHRRAATL